MNALTVAEIRLRHAQHAERAERLQLEGRTISATSPRSAHNARRARLYQELADDYASLLRVAEAEGTQR